MIQASALEVQGNFRRLRERAEEGEPILVQDEDAPTVVILSEDEYRRLKRRDKRVFLAEDTPDWMLEAIAKADMDPRHAHLDGY